LLDAGHAGDLNFTLPDQPAAEPVGDFSKFHAMFEASGEC